VVLSGYLVYVVFVSGKWPTQEFSRELKDQAGKHMITSLPIDFLIRIKNGYMAGRKSITAPYSKYCLAIADLLQKNHLIIDYSVNGDVKKEITLNLAYQTNQPAISDIKIHSRPGRRIYEKATFLPWGKSKQSLFIISTSSGIFSQKEAKSKGLGGEILAEIN